MRGGEREHATRRGWLHRIGTASIRGGARDSEDGFNPWSRGAHAASTTVLVVGRVGFTRRRARSLVVSSSRDSDASASRALARSVVVS